MEKNKDVRKQTEIQLGGYHGKNKDVRKQTEIQLEGNHGKK